MEIKALHLENDIAISDAMIRDVSKALQAFAHWHQTPQLQITRCDNADFKAALDQTWN